jgi:uncharacterized RmlC-like cupin family protein
MSEARTCRIVRDAGSYDGKQGLTYLAGISAESVGAQGICMHMLRMPPGTRAKAHLHAAHETAIYMLSGQAAMWYGENLEQHMVVGPGEYLYIPAGVPHLPYNPGSEEAVAILARSDPNEQESVVLRPELEAALAPAEGAA